MDYKRILQLHYTNGFSGREIASGTGDSKTAVNEFLRRFRECNELHYPLPDGVTNEYIEGLLYRKAGNQASETLYREIDCEQLHRALAHKGETLKHQWQKYNAEGEIDGKRPFSYRQYCRTYANWMQSGKVTFHIQRFPGVNLELDFAGKKLYLRDRYDPEKTVPVTIFIAALSYSGYFYAEGMTCCDIRNWIRVNNNALACLGGVTQTITPDNCKVAVTENKDWISPAVNKEFQSWAEHNGTVVLPAKVRSPRWKPVVEGTVKLVTMHILAEMSEMTFYSLDDLNSVLWEKMDRENRRPFSGLSYSREDVFLGEEKEVLLPLPETPYEYLERKQVKVSNDFSFVYDQVHYTMPRKYLKSTLEIRAGAKYIYVYSVNGDLIRTHNRSYTPKSWVVIPSDMPKEYGDYGYWNATYFLSRAGKIGPNTEALIRGVIDKFAYPVQSFRSCFGILRFADKYGSSALEKCCAAAVSGGHFSYTYIANTIPAYYDKPAPQIADRMSSVLKHAVPGEVITGTYKDDDAKYSLENLLRQQEEGEQV